MHTWPPSKKTGGMVVIKYYNTLVFTYFAVFWLGSCGWRNTNICALFSGPHLCLLVRVSFIVFASLLFLSGAMLGLYAIRAFVATEPEFIDRVMPAAESA